MPTAKAADYGAGSSGNSPRIGSASGRADAVVLSHVLGAAACDALMVPTTTGAVQAPKCDPLPVCGARPRGHLVDHDVHIAEDTTGPLTAADYSVLLTHATPGKSWSTDELTTMLTDAGIADVSVPLTVTDRFAVIAREHTNPDVSARSCDDLVMGDHRNGHSLSSLSIDGCSRRCRDPVTCLRRLLACIQPARSCRCPDVGDMRVIPRSCR
jgi:hypothetical protein